MNLWFSIGIAITGIVLGFLSGREYAQKIFRDLNADLIDSGILLLKVNPNGMPDEEGMWEGEPPELIEKLNKIQAELKQEYAKKQLS